MWYCVNVAKMDKKRTWYEKFIKSGAWADCSDSYKIFVGGLCERCKKQGKTVPADEVHHKIKLTPANVGRPEISLNWDNLEALCKNCHMKEHRKTKRWRVDEEGNVTLDTPLD